MGLTSGVAAISTGVDHACALTSGGGVKCWGSGDGGALGGNSYVGSNVPVDVVGLTSGVVSIATGSYNTCAVTTAGGVKCWGDNSSGQLGNNSSVVNSPVPVDVFGLSSGVTAVSVGDFHACATLGVGGIKCWGDNAYGQLGVNSTTDSRGPVAVVGILSAVTSIAAGDFLTCAVASGGVKCWGWNGYGQLGVGSTTNSLVPLDVVGLPSGVASISSSGASACALTNAGAIKCWGRNHFGQLGDMGGSDAHTPVNVVGFP